VILLSDGIGYFLYFVILAMESGGEFFGLEE
jgi:hypothetical protein